MSLQEARAYVKAAYLAIGRKDRGTAIHAAGDALGALGDASQNIHMAADQIQVLLQKTNANLTEGERRALWSELANIRQEAYIFGQKREQATKTK